MQLPKILTPLAASALLACAALPAAAQTQVATALPAGANASTQPSAQGDDVIKEM